MAFTSVAGPAAAAAAAAAAVAAVAAAAVDAVDASATSISPGLSAARGVETLAARQQLGCTYTSS